ncbi:MAG: transcriptional regulator [Desulfobacteraceae bacterium]|jgi:HTH-type transcriptional regulator/antitoxin HigA|nr:transcriptional regulator [Desulfobacterales bacterium]MBL6967040.1 transcriptional regulator [Desulfobacteraceae bacterium]MBL7101389.1 transcriptional regulator [Desulfobacteraceae bacterium]MBL7173922.1 transcriptional regulator [Desulfobacteraceae bacterium]
MPFEEIENEEEYERALSRVDALMDAKADTPEMDELKWLTLHIEAYEDVHYPMDPPDPVEAIKFRMEQLQANPDP